MIALRLRKRGSRFVDRQDRRMQALFVVLRGVRRFALDVPVDLRVDGTVPVSGPAIVVCPHNMLNQFVVARLVRDGLPVAVVVRVAHPPYLVGSSQPMDLITADPAVPMLRAVIRRLDAGKVVFAAIDYDLRLASHPHRLPVPGVERYYSTQLIRLAVERGVQVLFCQTRLVGLELVATIRRADGHDTEDIVRQFGEFAAGSLGAPGVARDATLRTAAEGRTPESRSSRAVASIWPAASAVPADRRGEPR
jgi:hypothetical protein